MFPLQELLEDESNQLFFGEVGKQMVIGLMTKAEKVGSLYNNSAVSCEHRDACSSIPTQSFSSVLEGENFICMLVTIARNKMPVLLILFNQILLKEPLCAALVHGLILCLTGANRGYRLCISNGIISRNVGKGKENQTFASTTYQLSDHWLSHRLSPKQGDRRLHSVSPLLAWFAYRCL